MSLTLHLLVPDLETATWPHNDSSIYGGPHRPTSSVSPNQGRHFRVPQVHRLSLSRPRALSALAGSDQLQYSVSPSGLFAFFDCSIVHSLTQYAQTIAH